MPSETLTILGPNGIGKSTLLKVLAGHKKPDAGRILWNQEDIHDNFAAYKQNLAWLGHQDALKPVLTVGENLEHYSKFYKTDMIQTLRKTNLLHLLDIPARLLSAGQKRRVALSRLLLKPATLWLLDEPTVGLDQESLSLFSEILHDFQKQGGMIIMITHTDFPLHNNKTLRLSHPSPTQTPNS